MKGFNLLLFTVVMAMVMAFQIGNANAQAQKYQRPGKKAAEVVPAQVPAKATANTDATKPVDTKTEKVDIQAIENQYWQQKDQDFHVVQNRRYSKDKRYFLSPTVGVLLNDSFTRGNTLSLGGGYYYDEQRGVEVSYHHYDTKDSKTTKEVKDRNGAPAYNFIQSQLTVTYNWMPIYGKVSLFDKSIIHFDMGINAGLGLMTYEQALDTGNESKTAVMLVLDITQQFFVSDNLAVRFDIRNRIYNENRQRFRINAPATTRESFDELTHSMSAALGIVYYFGGVKKED